MDKSEDRKEKAIVAVRMTRAEALLLKKRAKREGLSVSALIRRFALGLAALMAVGCGGGEFSSPATHDMGGGSGNGPTGSSGMSQSFESGGSGGDAPGGSGTGATAGGGSMGAAGAPSYVGPPYIAPGADFTTLIVRGVTGDVDHLVIGYAAPYYGPDYALTLGVVSRNGEFTAVFLTADLTAGHGGATETVEGLATLAANDGGSPATPEPEVLPGDVLIIDIGRLAPAKGGSRAWLPVDDITAAWIGAPDGPIAAWP